jgi:hypothetical protein
MRKLFASMFLLASAFALAPLAAQAQAPCPIASSGPVTKTAAYTLAASDICSFMVFATNASTLTLPAGIVTPGFSIWVKSLGVTTTISPATVSSTPPTATTLDGVTTSITLTTGTGVGLRSDGTAWWSTGLGISH